MILHDDGVYFGMPEAEYHDDPALGSTDIKRLLFSAPSWWAQSLWATGWRAGLELVDSEEVSAAKRFGRAVHTITLEGASVFNERYYVPAPKPADLPETKEQMRDALMAAASQGVISPENPFTIPIKSAVRDEFLRECRKAGVRCIDDWRAEQKALAEGREEISRAWATTILLIGKMLDAPRVDLAGKSQREQFLTRGEAEVSIFWTDERGVRQKARFDYLRIKSTLDVKTYGAPENLEPVAAFCAGIERYAYDLQAEHYTEARRQIGRMLAEGRVYECDRTDDETQVAKLRDALSRGRAEWVAKVAAEENPKWAWVAVQTLGMPETDVIEWTPGIVGASAAYQRTAALDRFVAYRDRFGLDTPWVSDRGVVEVNDLVLEAQGRARRMTDRGTETWKL